MRAYALIATTALVATALAPAASAAPKKKKPAPVPPACNLVKDAKGDVTRTLVAADLFPEDAGLDIVGGDVATGAKTVTALVRLAGPATASPLYVSRYIVEFNVAGLKNKVVLAAGVGLDGTTYNYGFYDTSSPTGGSYSYPGTATGAVKENAVTITANLADLAGNEDIGAIKKGARISGIMVSTKRRVPPLTTSPRGQLVNADDATSKSSYSAGQSSCLKPA